MVSRTPPRARSLRDDADGQWVRRWGGAEWFAGVDAWVRAELAAAGISVTGEPVVYKRRFWAVVCYYPTDRGLYWFKENNPGQAFEAGLVAAMARELPRHVVAPLAVEPARGWMLTADQGATLDERLTGETAALWSRLVVEYAGLQRDTVRAEHPLLASGLTPLAPDRLGPAVHAIADWYAGLTPSHPLAIGTGVDDVRRSADALAAWSSQSMGVVPTALDQNDLHARNVFSTGRAPFRFFDFGDAVWGHPFVTFACVRDELTDPESPGSWADDDPRLAALTDAYLAEWTEYAPLAVLRRELELVLPLHAVHRLVSWQRLLAQADEVEAAAWAASPAYWLGEVVRHFGGR